MEEIILDHDKEQLHLIPKSANLDDIYGNNNDSDVIKNMRYMKQSIRDVSGLLETMIFDFRQFFPALNELVEEKRQSPRVKIDSKLDASVGNYQLLLKKMTDVKNSVDSIVELTSENNTYLRRILSGQEDIKLMVRHLLQSEGCNSLSSNSTPRSQSTPRTDTTPRSDVTPISDITPRSESNYDDYIIFSSDSPDDKSTYVEGAIRRSPSINFKDLMV